MTTLPPRASWCARTDRANTSVCRPAIHGCGRSRQLASAISTSRLHQLLRVRTNHAQARRSAVAVGHRLAAIADPDVGRHGRGPACVVDRDRGILLTVGLESRMPEPSPRATDGPHRRATRPELPVGASPHTLPPAASERAEGRPRKPAQKRSVTLDPEVAASVAEHVARGAAPSFSAAINHAAARWVANQDLSRALDELYEQDPDARPSEDAVLRAATKLGL